MLLYMCRNLTTDLSNNQRIEQFGGDRVVTLVQKCARDVLA